MITALLAIALLSQQAVRDTPIPRAGGAALISGVVVSEDAAHTPVRHALVTLSGTDVATMITGRDGVFSFPGLAAGRYELMASKPGYAATAFGTRRGRDISVPIALGVGQQLTSLEIRLARGGVITGTLTNSSGEPLAGVSVNAARLDTSATGQPVLIPVGSAESNDDGVYRLYGLPDGEFIVTARPIVAKGSGAGYAPASYPGVTNAAEATSITVTSGEERAGVDLTLGPSPAAAVKGLVLDMEGRPVGGVEITLRASDEALKLFGESARTVRSGADGAFTFPDVLAGSYVASAAAPARALRGDAELSINGRDVSGLTLTLRRAPAVETPAPADPDTLGAVRGSVTDKSGVPSIDFLVIVFSSDQKRWTERSNDARVTAPDTNGDWSAEGLVPGDYRVAAITDWMSHRRVTTELLEQLLPSSAAITITAAETATIRLRVGG